MKLKLNWSGESSDGKRGYLIALDVEAGTGVCLEVDLDGVDRGTVMRIVQEIVKRCNAPE